jgi:hypothetical protein
VNDVWVAVGFNLWRLTKVRLPAQLHGCHADYLAS